MTDLVALKEAAKQTAAKVGAVITWDKQSEPMSEVRDGTDCRYRGDGVVTFEDGREYRFNAYAYRGGHGGSVVLRHLRTKGGDYSTKRGAALPPTWLPDVRAALEAALAVELAKISKARREAFLAKEAAAEPGPHDADNNPNWTPLIAWRVFACEKCGAETKTQTNHTGTIWAERCVGTCRQISNAHTDRETVSPHFGPHRYVREVELEQPETISGEPLGSDADNAAHREAGTQVEKAEDPKGFSVIGLKGGRHEFSAYAPTAQAGYEDARHYAATRPELDWQVRDATGNIVRHLDH